MESLLANYASSDEEGGSGRGDEDDEPQKKPRSTPSSLFSSLPAPRSTSSSPPFSSFPPPQSSSSSSSSSSSLFGSLPPPNSSPVPSSILPPKSVAPSPSPSPSSSLFSSLPLPKSQRPKAPPPSLPGPKKVVQYRPPINPALFKPDDADEDDDDDKDNGMGRKRSQDFASKPLSSIIPAPKHTLGLGPSSSRRTTIAADVPVVSIEPAKEEASGGISGDQGGCGGQGAGGYAAQVGVDGQCGSGALGGDVPGADSSGWDPSAASYESYGAYASFRGYDNYSSYGGQWDYGVSAAGATSATEMPESARTATKRGRDEIPSEILEVKQDELMKNRPREDQVRLTGIAFGPSYQPVSAAKHKPSKLHKRKHQIGSLFFDMKQKEMELAERRAKGFLTKKETQAKYGW